MPETNNYTITACLFAALAFAAERRAADLPEHHPRFLDADRDYVATIYRDGDNADWQDKPYDYVIEERVLDRKKTLELRLAAGGGTAIRFRPRPGAGL